MVIVRYTGAKRPRSSGGRWHSAGTGRGGRQGLCSTPRTHLPGFAPLGPLRCHRVQPQSEAWETTLAGIAPFIKKDQDKDHRRVPSRTQGPGVLTPHLRAAGGAGTCSQLGPRAPTDGAGLSCPLPVPPSHESWHPPPKALTLFNHQCPPPSMSPGPSLPDQWRDRGWCGRGDPLSAGLCL